MKILVTGAAGFVGKNLVASLHNIQSGKDRTHPELSIEDVFCFDVDSKPEALDDYCSRADFVFHLAGVNRPQDPAEFLTGNRDFTKTLLDTLKKHQNTCPILLSSSLQATLIGRYDNEYGRSKKQGEELLFSSAAKTGNPVYVYRFPNLFGKWCRPNYNSVVATFCHNTAHDLPLTVNDESAELELLYIDDLVAALLGALSGRVCRCHYEGLVPVPDADGPFCYVPITHRVTLGEIARLLGAFSQQPTTLLIPNIPEGSFAKKLYSTYLSYLPKEKVAFDLAGNTDARGSFTELLKTACGGQFSVNVSLPGVTKGQHWHHTKWEFFIVVSGHALIQMRSIHSDEVLEFDVCGERMQAVHMLPGYTHNIINLSKTEKLITLMWANEPFDPHHPDTYFQEV